MLNLNCVCIMHALHTAFLWVHVCMWCLYTFVHMRHGGLSCIVLTLISWSWFFHLKPVFLKQLVWLAGIPRLCFPHTLIAGSCYICLGFSTISGYLIPCSHTCMARALFTSSYFSSITVLFWLLISRISNTSKF